MVKRRLRKRDDIFADARSLMPKNPKFENFDLRIWLIRLAIVAVNIIMISLLTGTNVAAGMIDRSRDMTAPWMVFIPTSAGLLISFMPQKLCQALAVALTLVGLVWGLIIRAGVIVG